MVQEAVGKKNRSWSQNKIYRKIPLCKVKTDTRQNVCKDVEQTDLKELWAVGWEGVIELEESQPVSPIGSGHLSSISR